MLATATELAATPKWRRSVLDQPEVWGIQSISEEHVVIRIVVKTRSTDRDTVDHPEH